MFPCDELKACRTSNTMDSDTAPSIGNYMREINLIVAEIEANVSDIERFLLGEGAKHVSVYKEDK